MIGGARVFKTGIAVIISMYICVLFDIQPAVFAGATAVVNLQASLGKSLKNAFEQILTQFMAIGIAIILGLTIGGNPLIMGFSTILIILLCNHFKWRKSILGGIMAAIFVLGSPPDQFLNHALMRSLAIFIGLGAALLVNITLAPPRYEKPLCLKLLELNKFIMSIFKQVIHNYLELTPATPLTLEKLNKDAGKLFNEAHDVYDLYKHDILLLKDKDKEKQNLKTKFYGNYLTYNRGLWQRTKDIFFLTQERNKRRERAGDLPVSEDFQQILQLINNTLKLLDIHNQKLQEKITKETTDYVTEPHIWSKLEQIINQWHLEHNTESYNLHTLIEISLITYQIRWAAKESARLLDFENNGN